MKTINLKKKKLIGRKEIIVIISAIVLTTAGIKASDKVFNKNGNEAIDGKGCSQDMAEVSFENGSFCIDKYEASAGDKCPSANPQNQNESRNNLDVKDCRAVSAADAAPWTNISQNQAAEACAKSGKRLATNKEWQQAALGTPDKAEGWGNDDCNVAKNWDPGQSGSSGSGKNCVSSAGVYDMIGNVWEWVQGTIFDGSYDGRQLPKKGYVKGMDGDAIPSETDPNAGDPNYKDDYLFIIKSGTRAFARGGYWDNKSDAGQYAVYLDNPPSYAGAAVGFRCVR